MNNFLQFTNIAQISTALVLGVILLVYIAFKLSNKGSSKSRKASSR